jgi:hypothetical protein
MSTPTTGDTTGAAAAGDAAAGADTAAAATAVERCGQCGAPAAAEQRYCLNCGFHRRNAPDPVARYLSDASVARTRVAAADALAAQRRRTVRFGPRITATLVALALLVGLLIGNATSGGSTATPKTGTTAGSKATTTARTQTSAVKTATGSSYVNQENNLPDSVTP